MSARSAYRGRTTRTGNSLGIRFDKALFQSHPEFSGPVSAHVIAPGRMLIVAEPPAATEPDDDDPVLSSFLGLLEKDLCSHPEKLRPVSAATAREMRRLTRGVRFRSGENLGSDPLL